MKARSMIAVSLLLILWAITGISAIAAPVAEFETTTSDFGKPMEGMKTKSVFPFKNTGDADLVIISVKAACGCTDAKATENVIAPGKSAAIETVFNTAGYRSKVNKTVTITTNDPDHSTVVLTITGEIVPIAELLPQPNLNVGDMNRGGVSLNNLVIVPKIEQKFNIIRVISSGKLVTALAFDKKRNSKGNYALKIRVLADNTLGRFHEQVTIVTDLPGNPVIKFPVYGNIISKTAAK